MTGARIVGGPAGPGGYRALRTTADRAYVERTDLAPTPNAPEQVVLTIAHLSDLHICDHQSPARVEFLDRWADEDSPVRAVIDEIGTYRAQDMLTAQVAEAMVQAVNAVAAGPVGGAPVDLAIATGDNTDNAQANELAWYLQLLGGGQIHPDSGDLSRYEGVADAVVPDERFWHPELPAADVPQQRYGFPAVLGLLDAVRTPFQASGLAVPWLAVHGNHDRMLQGTVPGVGLLGVAAIGSAKPIGLPDGLTLDDVVALVDGLSRCEPSALEMLGQARFRAVTPDPRRRITTRAEFVAAHDHAGARPPRHGFVGTLPYYRFDHSGISLLVLDTVDEHGGWQGSLDEPQFAWLQDELAAADRDERLVILASHHPLATLVNDATVDGAGRRVLGDEVSAELARHPSVILWLNGHTHMTAVTPHPTPFGGWWEVTAPSLIDWPQQARIVEVLRGTGTITIATTMIDHCGPAPWTGEIDDPIALAGLSRELAANDWQWRHTGPDEHPRSGTPADRDVLLRMRDPFSS